MQSPYMEKAPENLEQDWLFIICPSGKRRIIVAANDITQTYKDGGATDLKFKSCLPSGNPGLAEIHKYDDLTILDSLYCPDKKCFYIIDMLHWKHYPYYETEAEFRFFCLPDKFSELKSPSEVSANNEYPLELLEKHPYSQSKLESALKSAGHKVEGVLFINKSSQYVCKDSEDTFWLKLDQIEKVLGFPLPEGVEFSATSEEDDKKKEEWETRQKLRADREAAKQKQDEEEQGREKQDEEEQDREKQDEEEQDREKQESKNQDAEQDEVESPSGAAQDNDDCKETEPDQDDGVWSAA
ncbi:unnamed protein product [Lymnaea stagnalis]|uniref:Snurportin-1 n=1 Tax=Lymnaea stagnalis TaxID=6523 RepID=A0AAV2H2F4_LYMST